MNPFQDKRFARAVLLLGWTLALLLGMIWLWVSIKPVQIQPPAIHGKLAEPAPKGMNQLFDKHYLDSLKAAYVSNNPFYYPVPAPPAPPPAPPPPAPTTQAHKLHYKGFFTTTHGDKFVYLSVDDALKLMRVGELVVEDLHLQEIDSSKLTLKTGDNSLSELVLELPFDVAQTPQVPLKKK